MRTKTEISTRTKTIIAIAIIGGLAAAAAGAGWGASQLKARNCVSARQRVMQNCLSAENLSQMCVPAESMAAPRQAGRNANCGKDARYLKTETVCKKDLEQVNQEMQRRGLACQVEKEWDIDKRTVGEYQFDQNKIEVPANAAKLKQGNIEKNNLVAKYDYVLDSPTSDKFTITEDDILYIIQDDKIYGSFDKGKSFAQIKNSRIDFPVVDFIQAKDRTFYVAQETNADLPGDAIIKKSRDGRNWETIRLAGERRVETMIQSRGGKTIYVGTSEGKVFKSEDGSEFQATGNLAGASVVNTLLEADNGNIFAGTDKFVYKSSNNGGAWDQLQAVDPAERERNIVSLFQAQSRSIFATTDSERNLEKMYKIINYGESIRIVLEGSENLRYERMGDVSELDGNVLFTGLFMYHPRPYEEGVEDFRYMISRDDGNSWETVVQDREHAMAMIDQYPAKIKKFKDNTNIYKVVIDDDYASYGGLKSAKTEEELKANIYQESNVGRPFAGRIRLLYRSGDAVYMVAGNSVYKSLDQGESWNFIFRYDKFRTFYSFGGIPDNQKAILETNEKLLLIATGNDLCVIRESPDPWFLLSDVTDLDFGEPYVLEQINDGVMMGTSNGLYKITGSNRANLRIEEVQTEVRNWRGARDIVQTPEGAIYVALPEQPGVIKSENNGRDWTRVGDINHGMNQLLYSSQGELYGLRGGINTWDSKINRLAGNDWEEVKEINFAYYLFEGRNNIIYVCKGRSVECIDLHAADWQQEQATKIRTSGISESYLVTPVIELENSFLVGIDKMLASSRIYSNGDSNIKPVNSENYKEFYVFDSSGNYNSTSLIGYQIKRGNQFYFWNGDEWIQAEEGNYEQSNNVLEMNLFSKFFPTFPSEEELQQAQAPDLNNGKFLWSAIFHSNGGQQVELDKVKMKYAKYGLR